MYLEASKKKSWAPKKALSGFVKTLPTELLPDDEPREPREPRNNRCELMYVLLRQSARNQPSHVACTFETQLSWLDNRPRGLRVTTRNSVGHESPKPCLQISTSVHESGKRTKECHVQYLTRTHEKMRLAEDTTEPVASAVSTSHTFLAFVAHGGSSSSSALPKAIPIVVHSGPALQIIRRQPSGVQAFRDLARRYNPRSQARSLAQLQEIISEVPKDSLLERLCQMRMRESDQLKKVLLCTNKKSFKIDHQKLKAMVKRYIDQKITTRNFQARNERIEKGVLVKTRKGKKVSFERKTRECSQWKAFFATTTVKRGKITQSSSLAPRPQTQNDGNVLRSGHLLEAAVLLERDIQDRAETTLLETVRICHVIFGMLPYVKITHLNRDAKSAKKCVFRHTEADCQLCQKP